MDNRIDLKALASELGPKFGEGAAERDESNRFVAENYLLLKEHKLLSAQIPAELGGGGATHGEMCGFVRAIGRHCGPTALTLSMHQHLVAAAVFNHAHGTPGQKLLEKVVAGETVLVSTGANDWLASNGAMERADGGYLVSAAKPFASGSPVGQVMVTSAPYEDPEAGWQVLHFPVPLSAEGVSLAGDWDTMGMRATGSELVGLIPLQAILDAGRHYLAKQKKSTGIPERQIVETAVQSLGLNEIAPITAADASVGLAVTLLRAVGWLSRDDLPTRNHKAAGPMIPTPEAQCIGVHKFQLGILPFTGDLATTGVRERSAE
ncbi:MAG: acyl-CoA dehydrogenase family protein, partial [Pseudomonadota bacterium]